MENVLGAVQAQLQVPFEYLKATMMRLSVPTLVAFVGVAWAQFGNNGAPVRPKLTVCP